MIEKIISIETKNIENAVAKEESTPVFVYKNGKKTDEIKGYKQKFMIYDFKNPLNMSDFFVRTNENYNFEVGTQVKIDYDLEESKIYATTKKDSSFANIQVSLVAKSISKNEVKSYA